MEILLDTLQPLRTPQACCPYGCCPVEVLQISRWLERTDGYRLGYRQVHTSKEAQTEATRQRGRGTRRHTHTHIHICIYVYTHIHIKQHMAVRLGSGPMLHVLIVRFWPRFKFSSILSILCELVRISLLLQKEKLIM